MAESHFFDRAERVDLYNTPLKFSTGTEHTKNGERNYLDVKLGQDFSVWGTLTSDKTEAWLEQFNVRPGAEDLQIVERLLRGFTIAAKSIGAQSLRVPSATPTDLYLLARVFGEDNLMFYDTYGRTEIALPSMTLTQALASTDQIRQVEDNEPYPLIGYFDVRITLSSVDAETWVESDLMQAE